MCFLMKPLSGASNVQMMALTMDTVRLHVGECVSHAGQVRFCVRHRNTCVPLFCDLISKLITHMIRPLVCACLASESQEFPSMVISLRSRCEDAFTSSPGAAVIPFPPGDFPDPR